VGACYDQSEKKHESETEKIVPYSSCRNSFCDFTPPASSEFKLFGVAANLRGSIPEPSAKAVSEKACLPIHRCPTWTCRPNMQALCPYLGKSRLFRAQRHICLAAHLFYARHVPFHVKLSRNFRMGRKNRPGTKRDGRELQPQAWSTHFPYRAFGELRCPTCALHVH
jgi:hypothetical protein